MKQSKLVSGKPEIISVWKFKGGNLLRIKKALRKGKKKIVLQSYKQGKWKTFQTLSEDKLPIIMENIKKKKGVKTGNTIK